MRRAARRDLAEAAIVEALLSVGCQVEKLQRPVDLLCHFRHRYYLMEVKTPTSHTDPRQKAQRAFCQLWEVPIVRTPEDALTVIGAVRFAETMRHYEERNA